MRSEQAWVTLVTANTTMDTGHQALHLLVDRLPANRIRAALSLLEQIGSDDVDTDPLSEEEQENLLSAEEDRRQWRMIPWEKVRTEEQ
jgi:hypothetical protein